MRRKIILAILVLSLFGCGMAETMRLFGFSLKPFKTQGKIYEKEVDRQLSEVFEDTVETLKDMKVTIHRKNLKQRYIVAFDFHHAYGSRTSASTEVAVFFEKLDFEKGYPVTRVNVSSLNYGLSEFVSEKIFQALAEK